MSGDYNDLEREEFEEEMSDLEKNQLWNKMALSSGMAKSPASRKELEEDPDDEEEWFPPGPEASGPTLGRTLKAGESKIKSHHERSQRKKEESLDFWKKHKGQMADIKLSSGENLIVVFFPGENSDSLYRQWNNMGTHAIHNNSWRIIHDEMPFAESDENSVLGFLHKKLKYSKNLVLVFEKYVEDMTIRRIIPPSSIEYVSAVL